uniref:Uncharacterized protein n=1 Tax=Chromera velia CCMP2878 TaxID=1169474 RepID=A0A0G4HZH6_9ALVE|eukprot:Cvel_9738.t1-p1 / transcript=Cvel_9738.t1 / gene=Cvel_9738 / organism=Chromera_velia_CCMP2878 / gene_product=hypothetical protein / transcript_product=hypothetical protein / location=Cvel_scaffold569:34493-36496(+) / protein_length=668 / sequence_SO=supercontig / SO=protein_coding / is_pseudo=false
MKGLLAGLVFLSLTAGVVDALVRRDTQTRDRLHTQSDSSLPAYEDLFPPPSYEEADLQTSNGTGFRWSEEGDADPTEDLWTGGGRVEPMKEEDYYTYDPLDRRHVSDLPVWDPLLHKKRRVDEPLEDPLDKHDDWNLPTYRPEWAYEDKEDTIAGNLHELKGQLLAWKNDFRAKATDELVDTLADVFTDYMLDIRASCQEFVKQTENIAIQKYQRRKLSKRKAQLKAEKEMVFLKQMCAFAAWDVFEETISKNANRDYREVYEWTRLIWKQRDYWEISVFRAKDAKKARKLLIAGKVAVATFGTAVGVATTVATMGLSTPLAVGIGLAVGNSVFANWAEKKMHRYARNVGGGGLTQKAGSLGLNVGLTFVKMTPAMALFAEGVQFIHGVADIVLSEELDKKNHVTLNALTKKRMRVLVMSHNLDSLMDDVEAKIDREMEYEKEKKSLEASLSLSASNEAEKSEKSSTSRSWRKRWFSISRSSSKTPIASNSSDPYSLPPTLPTTLENEEGPDPYPSPDTTPQADSLQDIDSPPSSPSKAEKEAQTMREELQKKYEEQAVREMEMREKRKINAEWAKWIPDDISHLGLDPNPEKGLKSLVKKYLKIRLDADKMAVWKADQERRIKMAEEEEEKIDNMGTDDVYHFAGLVKKPKEKSDTDEDGKTEMDTE